jgi:hypothetical protein
MARHSRYQHSWGIVTGLQLTKAYVVTAGIAIDGTGREVVVATDYALDPTLFNVYAQGDPNTLYPVFLNGVDQPASPSSNLTGACGGSQSTSMQENYSVTFGSPGSELQIADQTAPAITDGPDDGTSNPWLILLGFVKWDATKTQFTGVADFNPTSKVGRRYVGVNAAQVVSGSGSLLLATDPPGGSGVMAVEIQETPAQLIFGMLAADGSLTPALTVKANGDVIAAGQVSGTSIPVKVQVQSGVAFDGMVLPLPLGIDPANAAIHVQASLRYDANVTPPAALLPIPFPLECTVDPATRRVSCRVQWWDSTWTQANTVVTPAACDYVVIVAASQGAGS